MINFDKIFSNADTLFFIVVIEALLIILLVIYVAYTIWGSEDKKRAEKNSTDLLRNKTREANEWRSAFTDAQRELSALKRELNALNNERNKCQNNKSAYSNQVQNRLNTNQNNEPERRNQPYYSHADYAARERERGIYIKETTNDDGTVKSEIDFSLESKEPASVSIPPRYEYLEAANGGQFRKLLPSDEKCFFRTWEENGTRKFEFHGNVDKALANINAIFDDVCEIEGKQNGASNIENVEPGILDSKLNVEKPAKIKLIQVSQVNK